MSDQTKNRAIKWRDSGITPGIAHAMRKSGWWKDLPAFDVVTFQLYEKCVCVEFQDFVDLVSEVLARSVPGAELFGVEIIRAEFERRVQQLKDTLA